MIDIKEFAMNEELKTYYDELDPQKRKEILDRMDGDKPSFRRQMFKQRYVFLRKPERLADNWLFKCVYLPGLLKRRFLKKATLREINLTINEMFLNEELTHEERCELYFEMRNTVRRYLSTCRSPRYASSFFGFKKATVDEKKERAVEDIYRMSLGIAKAYHLEEKMSLWCQACRDELIAFDDSCGPLFDDYDERFTRKCLKK